MMSWRCLLSCVGLSPVLPLPGSVPEPPGPCDGLLAADGFVLPVGQGEAVGYYDAQPFGTNAHLGSDWNGRGGGNTDLGDPVHAMGAGRVSSVEDVGGGWGLVVRVVHLDAERCVESLYAHLDQALVEPGALVTRGQQLGTIGTAGGQYWAHLHFEVRDEAGLDLGGGYGVPQGQVDPTEFVRIRRPVAPAAQVE
jgi:murein DD-endopeptidase MepM/ murein hydrolase activator NlpD